MNEKEDLGDLDELNGSKWVQLLIEQPQYADRCLWEKLSANNWDRLLKNQPQFAKFKPKA